MTLISYFHPSGISAGLRAENVGEFKIVGANFRVLFSRLLQRSRGNRRGERTANGFGEHCRKSVATVIECEQAAWFMPQVCFVVPIGKLHGLQCMSATVLLKETALCFKTLIDI